MVLVLWAPNPPKHSLSASALATAGGHRAQTAGGPAKWHCAHSEQKKRPGLVALEILLVVPPLRPLCPASALGTTSIGTATVQQHWAGAAVAELGTQWLQCGLSGLQVAK